MKNEYCVHTNVKHIISFNYDACIFSLLAFCVYMIRIKIRRNYFIITFCIAVSSCCFQYKQKFNFIAYHGSAKRRKGGRMEVELDLHIKQG